MEQHLAEDYVGATQAAAILGVSRVTLHRWVKQGLLPAYNLGPRRVLIKRTDLEAMVRPLGEDTSVVADELVAEPLSDAEVERALRALERARGLTAAIAGRGAGGVMGGSAR